MDPPVIVDNEAVIAESLKVPRLYQKELLEEAKKRNIIMRADTGSGKTLVASELIVWTSLQPKATNHHQLQVFLVPTRPLVHQQAEFIQSRSNLRVKASAGDLQLELSKVDKLHSELNHIDVLVSTPKIFYDLISKGCWKFEDISLLIFDEAHHCRKNHIYNQIMRTQYHRLAQDPKQRLPKILGMTASPIWDYKNLQQAEKDIRSLQSALAAQLYEVKDQVEDISKYNFKPNESTVYYEPAALFQPVTQPPWEKVNQLIETHGNHRLVTNFKAVYSELGIYAYKLLIAYWLESLVTLDKPKTLTSSHLLDPSHQKAIKKVLKQLTKSLDVENVPENLLSSKILTLNKILVDYLENDEQRAFQCIVFVNQRWHAQLLPNLIECNAHLKDRIRPVALAGHGSNHNDCINFSMGSKAQNNAVEKLRSGESNLVVATDVAEEGLDFQTCNLVIRFDEITSWKGYIQSRGRARARDSDYIMMLPAGSGPKYSKFLGKEEEFRSILYHRPENELLDEGVVESTPQLICKLPSGNHSILTYNAATSVLNDVCQLVPSDEFLPSPLPDYEFEYSGSYTCKLTLPPMTALLPFQRTFVGEPMPTKKEAKRSAAFAACKLLRGLGVLTEYFLPHREDKTSQAQDANGRKLDETEIPDQVEAIVPNIYGDIWTSSEIWIHKLSFPDDSPSGSSTMGLLCERRLHIPDGLCLFNHFDQSKPLAIKFDETHKIEWDQDDKPTNLKKLEKFTRVVLQGAVNRRAYEGKLFFLIAPLLENTCEINWSLAEQPLIPLTSIDEFSNYPCVLAPIRQLHSRIIDSYELCPDLSDTSSPSLIPICPTMSDFLKKTKKFKTLGHFFKVVYDLKDVQYEGQSLVYLNVSFEPTNNLSHSESLSLETTKILLPLIICKGTHVPRTYWKMYSYLPSLTRILYDGCQARALCEKLNAVGTQAPLAIKALTPPGVGVPWDYQTLETVGDAFLKLATSIHVYLVHLKKGEGDMSVLRSRSVDNAYLRRKAIQANLPAYILSQRFRVDTFRDAQTENGKVVQGGNFSRKIPRRVLSDVVEALLGAGFLSGGVELGLQFGTALDLCFGGTTPWGERELNINFGNVSPEMLSSSAISKCKRIERKINYVFKNKLLLVQALTHRSANSFVTNCYEREEWLGDAVIDMWIVDRAYHRFINATAEELTLARAKVVSNGSLGFLAIKKLGLQDIIIHNSETFKQHCKEAVEAIKPFTTIGAYYSSIDNLFVIFDPPKILNDVLESIVGAVFVDSGFNLETIFRTLDSVFEEVIPELSQLVAHDPLSRLLEMRDKYQCLELERASTQIQIPNPQNGGDLPPISIRVCRISLHGQEVTVGQHAQSIGVAEQRAALEALKVLGENKSTGGNEATTTESPWSKCQCKSKSILLSTQGRVIPGSTTLKVTKVPDVELDNDELVNSLRGKKNKKKRAKLAKIQARVEASASNSNPVGNDSMDLTEGGSTNGREDVSITNKEDDSINNKEDDSIDIKEDGLIPTKEKDPIGTQDFDPINTQDDIHNWKEESINHRKYGAIDIIEISSLSDRGDEQNKDSDDESEKKRREQVKNDEGDESEKDIGNESKEKERDESEKKRDVSRKHRKDKSKDDDAPKTKKEEKSKSKKEGKLKEKSKKTVQDNVQAASKSNPSLQDCQVIFHKEKLDNKERPKGKSKKRKNKESGDIIEIKAAVPATDDSEEMEVDEGMTKIQIIEIHSDDDSTPMAPKKRKRKKDKRHRRSLVVDPDVEVIVVEPSSSCSVKTNLHLKQDPSSSLPTPSHGTSASKKRKKLRKISTSTHVEDLLLPSRSRS